MGLFAELNAVSILLQKIKSYIQVKRAKNMPSPGALKAAEEGRLYLSMQNYAQAEIAFRKAIDINPDYARFHFYLGSLYATQRCYNEAQQKAVEALYLSKDERDRFISLNFLAQVYANDYEYTNQVPRLQDAINIWEPISVRNNPSQNVLPLVNLILSYTYLLDQRGEIADEEQYILKTKIITAFDELLKMAPMNPINKTYLQSLESDIRNFVEHDTSHFDFSRYLVALQSQLGGKQTRSGKFVNSVLGFALVLSTFFATVPNHRSPQFYPIHSSFHIDYDDDREGIVSVDLTDPG